MLRDVEVNDPPAVVEKDDEDEQDSTDNGYSKEIDRAQRGDVIREEGSPCLRRRAPRPPHEPGPPRSGLPPRVGRATRPAKHATFCRRDGGESPVSIFDR